MKQWLKDGHFGTLVYGCYPEMMTIDKSCVRQITLCQAETPALGEMTPMAASSGSAGIYSGLCRNMDIAQKLGCGLLRGQGRIPVSFGILWLMKLSGAALKTCAAVLREKTFRTWGF